MTRAEYILNNLDEGAIRRAAHRVKGTYHREMARHHNKKMRPDFSREATPKEQEAEKKWDKHLNKAQYHISRSIKGYQNEKDTLFPKTKPKPREVTPEREKELLAILKNKSLKAKADAGDGNAQHKISKVAAEYYYR